MIYDSPIFADARGKLGNMVFSRNASGPYVRPYKIPANPQSSNQQANRINMAEFSNLWPTLTDQQQQGWNALAKRQRPTNSLGKPSTMSGLNLYVRQNMNRYPLFVAPFSDPPTTEVAPPAIFFSSVVSVENPDAPQYGDITLTLDPRSAPLSGNTAYYIHPFRSLGTGFWARNLFASANRYNVFETTGSVTLTVALLGYPLENPLKFAVGWRNIDLNSGNASPFQYLVATAS